MSIPRSWSFEASQLLHFGDTQWIGCNVCGKSSVAACQCMQSQSVFNDPKPGYSGIGGKLFRQCVNSSIHERTDNPSSECGIGGGVGAVIEPETVRYTPYEPGAESAAPLTPTHVLAMPELDAATASSPTKLAVDLSMSSVASEEAPEYTDAQPRSPSVYSSPRSPGIPAIPMLELASVSPAADVTKLCVSSGPMRTLSRSRSPQNVQVDKLLSSAVTINSIMEWRTSGIQIKNNETVLHSYELLLQFTIIKTAEL
jgi:hypothetical protein